VIDSISGVRKRGVSFIVRWQEDGAGRSFTSKDRSAVEKRREELLQQTAASGGNGILASLRDPGELRNLQAWSTAVEGAAAAAFRAVKVGDHNTLRLLRSYQTQVCELSAVWARTEVYERLEEELQRVVAYVEALHRGQATVERAPEVLEPARAELASRGLEPPAPAEPEPAEPRATARSLAFTLRGRGDPTVN